MSAQLLSVQGGEAERLPATHPTTTLSESAAIVQMIERAARDPAVDLDKLERLMAMRERAEAKAAEVAFNIAMKSAQAEMRVVGADALNPQTKSRYATYAKLDTALRPIYTKHGFSLSFDEDDSPKQEHIRVVCYVAHEAGHTRTYRKDMPADGKGAKGGDVMTKTHAAGAAASYGARYLLKGIFNIAVGEEDADGNMPAGPATTVSEEQIMQLREMIEATETDLVRFLAVGKIERLSDMPASDFDNAMRLLRHSGPTMMRILDMPQCSPEWYAARAGLPTASEFHTIMAKGKDGKSPSVTRRKYLYKLAGEIITGEPAESFSNIHMERGKAMEAEARTAYAFVADVDPQQVGFIVNGNKGCSPDSLIGNDGALEIKTKLPDLLIELLVKDEFPPEHKAQCQGVLWVAEREWIDIAVYWPKMPLFVKRAYRDNGYIANLAGLVECFNEELARTIEYVRRYGQTEIKGRSMSAPVSARWTGEAFEPLPRFRGQCDREFVVGETYTLTELEERSTAQHRMYFASIREAWASLPEHLAEEFPSPEHLRKRALVEAGFYDEQIVDAGSSAAAIRVAAAFRSREAFSAVVVRGPMVVIRSPKSQSYRAMPKGEFKRSIDAVLEIVSGLIGVTTDTLADEGQRAAA